MDKRIIILATLAASATQAFAGALEFESTTPANNAATRTAWLAAAGIASGQYFEDFEGYALDTNLHGVPLAGGLVINDTGGGTSAFVRGSSSFFGGSNPIDTRAVAHDEAAYLEFDFGSQGADYFSMYDIDHTGGPIIVTYIDDSTESFSLDSTGGSGNSAEFWGIYRNDMPLIKKLQFNVGGDGEWGVDNLEYNAVPEPATMVALGLGAAALLKRRRK